MHAPSSSLVVRVTRRLVAGVVSSAAQVGGGAASAACGAVLPVLRAVRCCQCCVRCGAASAACGAVLPVLRAVRCGAVERMSRSPGEQVVSLTLAQAERIRRHQRMIMHSCTWAYGCQCLKGRLVVALTERHVQCVDGACWSKRAGAQCCPYRRLLRGSLGAHQALH